MRVWDELIDLVFPAQCLCCDRPGGIWCLACQPAARPRLVTPQPVPPSPIAEPDPATGKTGPPVFAAGDYAEELRTVLIAYKERGRRQLAERLADYLGDAVDCAARAAASAGRPVLVPVPSTRRAARARGGDHVLRLARLVGRRHALPVRRAIRLTGPVRDSAGLSVEQRRRNLSGRMVAVPPPATLPPGAQPILLDDIVTTGVTLTEAARALRAAGWAMPSGAVIAATRLRLAAADRTPDDQPAEHSQAPGATNPGLVRSGFQSEVREGSTGQNVEEGLAFI